MTVRGGWRQGPNDGGVPLGLLALLALPLGVLAWRRWRAAARPAQDWVPAASWVA